ncbi:MULTISPECIES: SDR family oxidoreductase [unclassified Tolypothrix]|uniref:SDR family oxidoreductase n=1 Tax=unclassified Tolypothrix TaxID=2649714 RepID=UPI0005EAB28E|nr:MULTISPECIES: SDR family oxidoreductase [unclassified Tolypothrix]BAY88328.1 short-chain dehydrogenase/reductase SDR HrmU [Microchaete diplosiphon NIES-3275]EKF02313.1 oxidoreductase, short chain dehydrogenase/reductase family protein [Tolypothrix sp. PCC 7601]MBE9083657.1 SDR family oxidoreductase [Tolypothrix sp. LEGE 11397]UYD29016.1 SDR family oxidoreductase [Tolypothrix sp. PCC 7712]UYD35070.1 SDR family oxidoreductase [Tolypothrix sp. PCC 7601]
MPNLILDKLFSLQGQVAVITGGSGVLGGAIARGLGLAGARVVVLGRNQTRAEAVVKDIIANGGESLAVLADVSDRTQLEIARDAVLKDWGQIDILINAAGGNVPAATITPDATFFDMPHAAFEQVVSLNLVGTLLPSQVFGEAMVEKHQPRGCIVNISSMSAIRVISQVVGYSAAKAGIDNFTRWLAVELAQKYGAGLRVNAIAPGFFIGEQNRDLLLNPDGSLSDRGQKIIEHTPAGRFGEPEELLSTVIWLCSAGSSFINGVVVPVDGGFSIYSGV